MLRSMFSGVSGLRSHQTMMDVIGNNIANVNTVGYKSSSVVFQDMLSQVMNGAGVAVPGASGAGGTNPTQVGLGVQVGSITASFSQGASQLTGRTTDLAIQGDGFLTVRQNGEQLYTRNGALNFDGLGRVVTSEGGVLQGWLVGTDGKINTNANVADLVMPLGQSLAPQATQSISLGGNLDATPPATYPGTEKIASITVYDAQGKAIAMQFGFKATGANAWSVQPYGPDGSDTDTNPDTVGSPISLTFDPATGKLTEPTTAPTFTIPASLGQFSGPITLDLGTSSSDGLRQYAGASSVTAVSQDGSALGALNGFTIGQDGTITGVFSNGHNRALGQIALSSFSNPAGLEKGGESMFRATGNSGLAQVGVPNTAGRGTLMGSTLEMSNVDLAQEFTNLILAQRGFQANSKVITASDELLQDLVNLKR